MAAWGRLTQKIRKTMNINATAESIQEQIRDLCYNLKRNHDFTGTVTVHKSGRVETSMTLGASMSADQFDNPSDYLTVYTSNGMMWGGDCGCESVNGEPPDCDCMSNNVDDLVFGCDWVGMVTAFAAGELVHLERYMNACA
jgi:hypothetical protein